MNSNMILQKEKMLSILPDENLTLVNTFVKKLIKAWDPDFTKLTDDEKRIVDEADDEIRRGIYFTEDDVWN